MSETTNVFTDLGEGRHTYKEFQDLGIITGPRTRPRMLDKGKNGFYLGLYDPDWAATACIPSGAETYFVRVVPTYSSIIDPQAESLKGVPNIENTTKGVTFYFEPFPDGYSCQGYEVWAGTVSGTLYLQGILDDRFSNTFIIGTTWAYNGAGTVLDPLLIGPPAFASLVSVYQAEGEINSRIILAGGKKYNDGYAQVSNADSKPVLTTGAAESDSDVWALVAAGSFRMRIDGKFYNFTDIDFSGVASMADVATVLQTKVQSLIPPIIYGGDSPETTISIWAAITDGSFNVYVDGVSYDIEDLDFSSDTTMAQVAATIQAGLQGELSQASVEWDSVSGKFIVSAYDVTGSDQIANGDFAADTDWTKEAVWTIGSGKANLLQAFADGAINGDFATDSDWTKGSESNGTWTISSGKARITIQDTTNTAIGISQDSLVVGQTYNVSFDIGANAHTLSGFFGWATGLGFFAMPNNATVNKSYSFIAATTTFEVSLYINDLSGTKSADCTLDDVVLDTQSSTAMYQQKASGSWNSAVWSVQYTVAGMSSGDERFKIQIRDASGNIAATGTTRATNGTFTDVLTVNADNTYNRIYMVDLSDDADSYTVDDVSMTQVIDAAAYLSYLQRHSSATGTDVSQIMACRGDSEGAYNTIVSKQTSTHTVAWSTDRFIFTGPTAGSDYRLSLLETADGNIDTDISGADYLNGVSAGAAVYSSGKTAKRTVIGTGTEWGDWATGMSLLGSGEADEFLIKEIRSETELILDEDYTGDLFDGWKAYSLEPFDDQIYVSDRGNPFAFRIENIIKIPVEKSEGITTLKNSGPFSAILLQESSWIVDAVDISSPLRVSPDDGCPNNEAAIEYENGVAFYSGDDFKVMSGRNITSLDPEDRMRGIIGRISSNAPLPMGVYLPDVKANILVWIVGLDGSYTYNTGICFNVKTGAWWLWNLKDANCVTALKDDAGKFYMATGSTYDDAHSVSAFVKLYSRSYFNDGASQSSSNTKQGTIATGGIGAPTATAGFLTCGSAFSSTYSDWTGITEGYFKITIDDVDLDVGPCDFSSATDMDDIAAVIQVAIRAATNAGGSELTAWSVDHFVITSGTTTNRSTVDYMRPYYPTVNTIDLSSVDYCNGRKGVGTKTWAQNHITLTLQNWADDAAAVIETDNDGEDGVYLAFATADGESLQYCLITSNTANTVTITPVPSSLPEAGWRWFLGGIVPTWFKWMDFGSPQHLQKLVALAFTTEPNQVSARNYLHMLYYHDLKTTLRRSYTQQLGTSIDTVNTLEFRDREATQHGIKLIRPSSEHDLNIEDITITHHPIV